VKTTQAGVQGVIDPASMSHLGGGELDYRVGLQGSGFHISNPNAERTCGCCTVLVDGDARVACVTPAPRVAGRSVTTLAGLPPESRDALVDAFVATGASQCGFCTPGILVRLAALAAKGRTTRTDVDRALAAHLCRCTGWQTIHEAFDLAKPSGGRSLDAAERRAALETLGPQRVGPEVPQGDGGFADDIAPRVAETVAVPAPPGCAAETMRAAGLDWVVGDSLLDARARAGKVQGRRSTVEATPPLPVPDAPEGGVALATGWVEPAYLESDASWCTPGGEPATPLANGGAFGGKVESAAPIAARELADGLGRPVCVVYSREDVVRLGPKRPPIAATAALRDGRVELRGRTLLAPPAYESPYAVEVDARWEETTVLGPPVSNRIRAAGLAECAVLVEGALDAAHADRAALVDARGTDVLLDTLVRSADGALSGARVEIDDATGRIEHVTVRVDAGEALDDVVLRSYAIGATHMALGWVLTEGLAVDPETGDVLDLTIRSFGIIPARSMPPVTVEIVTSDDVPRALSSDAVFAAVAAATWNAVTHADGARPDAFPAVGTRAARMLRR
jgi:aerobic-type carbon monoxide dehydrogenase small subunit (CoxS/CutS family)